MAPKTIKEVEDKVPFHFWDRVKIKSTWKEWIVVDIRNWRIVVATKKEEVCEYNWDWYISTQSEYDFDQLEFWWYEYLNQEIYIARLAHSMAMYAKELEESMKNIKK